MQNLSNVIVKDFSYLPSKGGVATKTLKEAEDFFKSIKDIHWHSWQLFVCERLEVEGSFEDVTHHLDTKVYHGDKKRIVRLNYQIPKPSTVQAVGPTTSHLRFVKRYERTVDEIVNGGAECPLDLSIIPNTMGINLCSVGSVTWDEQEDGQLLSITIRFMPNNESSHMEG